MTDEKSYSTDRMHKMLSEVSSRLDSLQEEMRKRYDRIEEKVDSYIGENPKTTVLSAFSAGAVAGALGAAYMRNRKDKRYGD